MEHERFIYLMVVEILERRNLNVNYLRLTMFARAQSRASLKENLHQKNLLRFPDR